MEGRNGGEGWTNGERGWREEEGEDINLLLNHYSAKLHSTWRGCFEFELIDLRLEAHLGVKHVSLLKLSLCHVQHAHHPGPRLFQSGNCRLNQLLDQGRWEPQTGLCAGRKEKHALHPFHRKFSCTYTCDITSAWKARNITWVWKPTTLCTGGKSQHVVSCLETNLESQNQQCVLKPCTCVYV